MKEKITDLKDMLNKTKELYGNKTAYKIRNKEKGYKTISHLDARNMIDYLGTSLINMGLKDKKIAIIGENRYEWGIAYLSITCGTGIVVPLDKALPENELEKLIKRSEINTIFFTEKYLETIKKIKNKKDNNLENLISFDYEENTKDIYSFKKLIEDGKKLVNNNDRRFIDAKIDPNKMQIMLFTSGTTSESKVVALSHNNICSNLMDLGSVLDVNTNDILFSNLPLHHVFECTVGFLFGLYTGASTVYSDGIRHIVENLVEYKPSIMFCVPGIYERILIMIKKKIEKAGRLEEFLLLEEKAKNLSMEQRKEIFKPIHEMLGGNIKSFFNGAAALDPKVEQEYRLIGFNLAQGYGLTESSPVVAVGTKKDYRLGTIGKPLPHVKVKLVDINKEGMGELVVKGPNVMLGYYKNEKATKETIKNGWLYTGDLAKIDDDGFIYICGRKKSVIVLKNGKNIFPEEIENLINKIPGVEESFIFGKKISDDKDNIKINVKIVFNKENIKEIYKVEKDEEIHKIFAKEIKKINQSMPNYKSIKGIIITEKPLIKTTTNKIKRQLNLDEIEKSTN